MSHDPKLFYTAQVNSQQKALRLPPIQTHQYSIMCQQPNHRCLPNRELSHGAVSSLQEHGAGNVIAAKSPTALLTPHLFYSPHYIIPPLNRQEKKNTLNPTIIQVVS